MRRLGVIAAAAAAGIALLLGWQLGPGEGQALAQTPPPCITSFVAAAEPGRVTVSWATSARECGLRPTREIKAMAFDASGKKVYDKTYSSLGSNGKLVDQPPVPCGGKLNAAYVLNVIPVEGQTSSQGAEVGVPGERCPTSTPTNTPRPIVTPTLTATPTASPTATASPTPFSRPTLTDTPFPTTTPVSTRTPVPTKTPVPAAAHTPTPTDIPTIAPTPTFSPTPSISPGAAPVDTPTGAPTVTQVPTQEPAQLRIDDATITPVPTVATPQAESTQTIAPRPSPALTPTATPSPSVPPTPAVPPPTTAPEMPRAPSPSSTSTLPATISTLVFATAAPAAPTVVEPTSTPTLTARPTPTSTPPSPPYDPSAAGAAGAAAIVAASGLLSGLTRELGARRGSGGLGGSSTQGFGAATRSEDASGSAYAGEPPLDTSPDVPLDTPLDRDLSGFWAQENLPGMFLVLHQGTIIRALRSEPWVCLPSGPVAASDTTETGYPQSRVHFEAKLDGSQMEGEIDVCRTEGEQGSYWVPSSVQLSLTPDAQQLTGVRLDDDRELELPISLSRVADPQLTAADFGLPSACLRSYGHRVKRVWRKSGTVLTVPTEYPVDPDTDERSAWHMGVDFISRDESWEVRSLEFRSPVSGVVYVHEDSQWRTLTLRLETGDLLQFLHSAEILVQTGERVDAGTVLGRTGSVGTDTIHLHVQARNADGDLVSPDWVVHRARIQESEL